MSRFELFRSFRRSNNPVPPIRLSIIMPYYRRFEEFSRVFPRNYEFVGDPDFEVLLCLDEDSEQGAVLDFIEQFPDVKWKVIVNHQAHPWRPPSRAINVGLRHASGDYVLICSPESLFVGDLPHGILSRTEQLRRGALVGKLSYCTFDDLSRYACARDAAEAYYAQAATVRYYGSICVVRRQAIRIAGYDECFARWGGDDDNFRARLEKVSCPIVKSDDVHIMHLSFELPVYTKPDYYTPEYLDRIFRPRSVRCPTCSPHWGRAFDDVVKDWRRSA